MKLEESVGAPFEFASNEKGVRVAVAFDGFLTWERERRDAIYVETIDRPTAVQVIVAQRYKPKRRLFNLKRLGDPVFLDPREHGRLRA